MSQMTDRLLQFGREGKADDFEAAWLEAIEATPAEPAGGMLAALEALGEAGKAERAATCGAMWLEQAFAAMPPAQQWDAAGRILLLGDTEELRKFAADAFRAAHAGRGDIESLLTVSGLTGRSSPKRAMRLLGIAMRIGPGSPLLDQETGGIRRVAAVGPEGVTVTGGVIEELLTLSQLASRFVLVAEDDYRVLAKDDPERLRQLVEDDPEAFLVNVLRVRGTPIRGDDLKRMVAGPILPADRWAGWWSKARDRIKTSRHVVSEGRNPVVLTYVEGGMSLEDQAWDAFAAATTDAAARQVVSQYLRDAKAAGSDAAGREAFLDRVIGHYRAEFRRQSGHSEPAAFVAAMAIEQLNGQVGRPVGAADSPVLAMLRAGEPVRILAGLEQVQLWPLALQVVREGFSEDWPALYLSLMPVAPVSQLDEIAGRLIEAGKGDAVRETVAGCVESPLHCPDVLAWVWKRPAKGVEAFVPAYESMDLLLRIFSVLEESEHAAGLSKKQANRLRQSMRAALAERGYGRYQECLDGLERDMAMSLRARINLIAHLSAAGRSDLLKFISRKFPSRTVHDVPKWAEENSIYTTAEGLARRREELRVIVEQKIPANAIAIGRAREKGDLSENAEYTAALEERGLLGERAGVIQAELNEARVLTAAEIAAESVEIGTRLRLRNLEEGIEVTITLLGPWDADIERHVYSYKAPMFQEMMGKGIGDEVELRLEGHGGRYEILSIENALATP